MIGSRKINCRTFQKFNHLCDVYVMILCEKEQEKERVGILGKGSGETDKKRVVFGKYG